MNRRIFTAAFAVTLVGSSFPAANAAVVTSGCGAVDTCTMSELFAGGEFTSGNLRFHAFSLITDAGSKLIDEDTVSLTGIDPGGIDPGAGFRFNGNGELATAAGDDIAYVFEFEVETVGGAATIKDASLTAGTGSVGADDEWRVQARIPAGNFLPDIEIVDSTLLFETVLSDSVDFAETGGISVRHALVLDSFLGLDASGAALDDYTFQVSQVPLPAGLPLLLTALGLLALIHRRPTDGGPAAAASR